MQYHVEPANAPRISSTIRLQRRNSYQVVVALPAEAKERLDQMIEGGSIAAAISGLVVYGMDQLEKEKARLVISKE